MQITSDAKIEILKDSEERPLLVLESRQKTALAFGVVMMIGLIACTSYLVGRRLSIQAQSPAQPLAAAPPRVSPQSPKQAPPVFQPAEPAAQAPVLQASAAPAPTPVAQAVTPAAVNPAPAAVVPPPAAPASQAVAITPMKGQNFLQVGFLTPDTVEPFLDRLKAGGFQGKMAPGDDKRTVRVLVGPLKAADVMTVSAELTKAGFPNFPKYF